MRRDPTQPQLDLVTGPSSARGGSRQLEPDVQTEAKRLLKQLLLECARAAMMERADDGQDHAGSP